MPSRKRTSWSVWPRVIGKKRERGGWGGSVYVGEDSGASWNWSLWQFVREEVTYFERLHLKNVPKCLPCPNNIFTSKELLSFLLFTFSFNLETLFPCYIVQGTRCHSATMFRKHPPTCPQNPISQLSLLEPLRITVFQLNFSKGSSSIPLDLEW